MYHLDNTSGVPEMPEPKEQQSITPRWFGESQEQGGISWPGADWFNIIQAELLAILQLEKESPDKTRFDQLASTIKKFSGIPFGSGKVRDGITFLTPELFGAVGDGIADDSFAVIAALEMASQLKIKGVLLGKTYAISTTLPIPSDVCLYGNGDGTGLVLQVTPETLSFKMISMAGTNSICRDFSISYNVAGKGSIAAVSVYGVFFESSSSYCKALNLNISGRHNGSGMGFSNGIRVTGSYNDVINCRINYATMGMTLRGVGHNIDRNYCNNHFLKEGEKNWSSASYYWDGITCEGLSYSQITNNVCEENGQSGIYIGGNGSLSHTILIQGNLCCRNWNRGLDFGISGEASATNNVSKLRIMGNHARDNREPQIWLFGPSNSVVSLNIAEITDEYDSLFSGYFSGNTVGIALGYTTACTDNVVTSNRISTRSTDTYSIVANGLRNFVKDNSITGAAPYLWANDKSRLVSNNISGYQRTFTPVIVSGTGLSVSSSKGYYSINGATVSFSIQLTFTASSLSGPISVGYIPGIASAETKISKIMVDANGWSPSMNGVLKAYQDVTNRDQIVIYRDYQGSRHLDAAAHVLSGSTITISGDIEITKAF